MNGLHLSPRQLYEASRLADRLGPAVAHGLDRGRVLLLMATRLDAEGRAEPDLALELDRDGQVVASQFLDLAHRDEPDDELADLSDEQRLPEPVDVRHARAAKRCECDDPFAHEGFCARCGRSLPAEAVEPPSRVRPV
jgi:hypothetical protein